MNTDTAIELIKLALGQITIFDLSEEARASAKPTNYKNKEVNLYDGRTFYFPYDDALNVIIDTIENEYNKALEDFANVLIDEEQSEEFVYNIKKIVEQLKK